jgi:hypothetical protein
MKWLAMVLALAAVVTGCGSADKDKADPGGPTNSFSTPTDGSQQIAQGTAPMIGDVTVGVGSVLTNPDRAVLSVRKASAEAESLTLGVGEKGTVQGQTVTVTAIQHGDHDYVWVKVSPS